MMGIKLIPDGVIWLGGRSGLQVGGAGITYFLRDQFTTDAAAPLSTPRTSQPGPGQMQIVADANSRLFTSGGALLVAAGTAQTTDPKVKFLQADGSAWTKARGLALKMRIPQYQNLQYSGWFTNVATPGHAYEIYAAALQTPTVQYPGAFYPLAVDDDITIYLSLRSTGVFVFMRGSSFGVPALIAVMPTDNPTTLYPAHSGIGVTSQKKILSDVRVLQMTDTRFTASDTALAAVDATSPASGTAWTVDRDVIGRMIFSLPGSPSAGDYAEVRYRIIDANNYFAARIEWNNGTSQWDGKINRVTSGVTTALTTKANLGASTTEIQARFIGTYQLASYRAAAGYTAFGSAAADTQGISYQGCAVYYQNVTVSKVEIYKQFDAVYNALDGSTGEQLFFAVGDSKTQNQRLNYGWLTKFQTELQTQTGQYWHDPHYEAAVGGYTIALMASNIAALLAARADTPVPNIIWYNLGANDVSALDTESNTKANYLAIIDAVNAKYPGATHYITRPWRRSYGTNCNTLAGWIADIVASRSSFCKLGDDERVWYEHGDDGATYSSDGIHYNAAGSAEAARQRRIVIAGGS